MSDIITVSTNNSYSLRSVPRNDLVLKHKPKTKYIKDLFNYYSMTVWNKIPIEIRSAANIKINKLFYKKYLSNTVAQSGHPQHLIYIVATTY